MPAPRPRDRRRRLEGDRGARASAREAAPAVTPGLPRLHPGARIARCESMGPLFTVGHSTRTLDELVRICDTAEVRSIVDVRRFPGSRRSPHFARQALEETLPARGIDYLWLAALGGHRRRPADAPPSPWQVAAFAAYADHMRTAEFREGFTRLLAAAAD